MLIKQILKQSRKKGTRGIHVEDFSNLQLCEKTEQSKSTRFDNGMKIFKHLHFSCLTENNF